MNLSEIPLENTGLYNRKYSFSQIFKKNNITTLSQVLDDNTINNLYNNMNSNKAKEQLKGYISLLKYKYLNIPLPEYNYLERKSSILIDNNSNLAKNNINYFYPNVNFNKMGFNSNSHITTMITFAKNLGKYMNNLELIDFFRLLYKKSTDNTLNNTINIYINAYNKKHSVLINQTESQDETKFLRKKINTYDELIIDIEKRIFSLKRNINIIYQDNYKRGTEKIKLIEIYSEEIKFLLKILNTLNNLKNELENQLTLLENQNINNYTNSKKKN